jgi:hypothetical protein
MTILAERTASPGQIAKELDEPVNNVSYHINVLVDLGCIELVSTEPSQGGRVVEHLYRATQSAYLDAEAWELLGDTEKLELVATLMRLTSEDIAHAMAKGTFFDPDDNHLSRSPMTVDGDGWHETISLLYETAERLAEIQDRVNERTAEGEAEMMPIKVVILQFRSPSPNPE